MLKGEAMHSDVRFHIEVTAHAAGDAILDSEERLLMVREKQGAKSGLWHIPSGSVKTGESLESAVHREVFEETGLRVTLMGYLNTYLGRFFDGEFVMRHVWVAEPIDESVPRPIFTDEIEDIEYKSWTQFMELYEQGMVRMYHTKLIFEDVRTWHQRENTTGMV